MKIKLSPEEVSHGKAIRRWSSDIYGSLLDAIRTHQLVTLNPPVSFSGKRVCVICPRTIVPMGDRQYEFGFRPIWNRVFTVNKMRTDDLERVILDLDGRQVEFDHSGKRPSSHRTTGPGCDPRIIAMAETALPKLLDTSHLITTMVRSYLWEEFSR